MRKKTDGLLGNGLAISKTIVQQFKGKIWIRVFGDGSGFDHETTFGFNMQLDYVGGHESSN